MQSFSTYKLYSYGMLMPGRHEQENTYEYGFNGMRKDDEIKGQSGTSYDFGARMYDSRVGRWLSIDPHFNTYNDQSPYNFALNSPLAFKDPDGKDAVITFSKDEYGRKVITMTTTVYMAGVGVDKNFVAETQAIFDNNFKSQVFTSEINGETVILKLEANFVDLMAINPASATKEELSLQMHMKEREAGANYSTPAKAKGAKYGLELGNNMMIIDNSGEVSNTDRLWSQTVLSATENGKSKSKEQLQYHSIHELMHLYGLSDRYNAKIVGGKPKVENHEGYANDWMGYGRQELYERALNNPFHNGVEFSQAHIDNLIKAALDMDKTCKSCKQGEKLTSYNYNLGEMLDSDDPNREKSVINGEEH